MTRDFDKLKTRARDAKRSSGDTKVQRHLSGLLNGLLYLGGYGGIAVVAAVLVVSATQTQAAPELAQVPLQATANTIKTGQHEVTPPAPPEQPAPEAIPESEAVPEPEPELVPEQEPEAEPAPEAEPETKPEAPAEPAPASEPVAAPAPAPELVVQAEPDADGCLPYPVLPGDTFAFVATRLKLSKAKLKEWNPDVERSALQAVSTLRICDGKRTIVRWREHTHVVVRGDTLYKLAADLGLEVANLSQGNRVPRDRINLGQKLTVYEAVWSDE